MAAEKPDKKDKKKEKKEKKRAETDGVTKSSSKSKDKKDKKQKLEKKLLAEANQLDEKLQAVTAASAAKEDVEEDDDVEIEDTAEIAGGEVKATLVPFAKPLADEKHAKKVLKAVRKSAKSKTLKRGVKEVVKTLRKSPAAAPNNVSFPGVVVLAGDISPMDVISHIPVLCEDHNVPYIFVSSRAELGAAGATKRPTSVVMVCEKTGGNGVKGGKKKDGGDEEEGATEEFAETYKELVKLVQKETLKQVKV